jgi:hypothetical protein
MCTMCDGNGTLLCSGCKSIHYCSAGCQRMDWPVHKIVCKDYAQFLTARPDYEHHSVVYFSPDKPKPRFVWLPFEPGHNHPSFDVMSQYGVCDGRIKARAWEELTGNPMIQRHMEPHHILLSLPENTKMCPCCNKDLAPNQSLTMVDKELCDFYRGPILACGTFYEADPVKKTSNLDLKPVDFRHVVDNLRKLYCEDTFHDLKVGDSVKAVRLKCEGDTFFCDRSLFEAVLEHKSALLLESEIPTPDADKIGIPLIVRKLPPAVV